MTSSWSPGSRRRPPPPPPRSRSRFPPSPPALPSMTPRPSPTEPSARDGDRADAARRRDRRGARAGADRGGDRPRAAADAPLHEPRRGGAHLAGTDDPGVATAARRGRGDRRGRRRWQRQERLLRRPGGGLPRAQHAARHLRHPRSGSTPHSTSRRCARRARRACCCSTRPPSPARTPARSPRWRSCWSSWGPIAWCSRSPPRSAPRPRPSCWRRWVRCARTHWRSPTPTRPTSSGWRCRPRARSGWPPSTCWRAPRAAAPRRTRSWALTWIDPFLLADRLLPPR